MRNLVQQDLTGLTGFPSDQSAGLVRRQATGAAALAAALATIAVVAALRADPDIRSGAQGAFAAGAIAVSASVTPAPSAAN
jgi:hypothetical protein